MKKTTAFGVLLVALSAGAADAAPTRIDQIAYAARLRAARPDLWLSRVDRCKDQLILKPAYRDRLLQGKDEYAAIVSREYAAELKAKDRAWADAHRALARKLKSEQDETLRRLGLDPANTRDPALLQALDKMPFYVRAYPEENFVGYGIGRGAGNVSTGYGLGKPSSLDDYLLPKGYLQLRSAADDLSPEAYVAFTRELSQAGYRGDSKVQLRPGVARFKFNNVVLHARAKEDVRIAERVAERFFGDRLAAIGRGYDVDMDEDEGLDWSQFLCIGDLSRLPKDAVDFVTYKD